MTLANGVTDEALGFGLLPPGMAGREPWNGPDGEGISYAMESARFAAEFIIDASSRSASSGGRHDVDAHLSRYADYVREQWGSHFTPVLMRFVVRLLANLTDPAAKGFEDRVIRVLELLVPATSNTSAATNQRYPQQKVRVNP